MIGLKAIPHSLQEPNTFVFNQLTNKEDAEVVSGCGLGLKKSRVDGIAQYQASAIREKI